MYYKLAKQLKLAGFKRPIIAHGLIRHPNKEKNELTVYIPTLSELIDACPKTFKKGTYFNGDFTLSVIGDKWIAGYEATDWFEEGGVKS